MGLIEDVAAARQRGISYGKYMETKPPSVPPSKPAPEGNGHSCYICGQPLTGRFRKYCISCMAKYSSRTLRGD